MANPTSIIPGFAQSPWLRRGDRFSVVTAPSVLCWFKFQISKPSKLFLKALMPAVAGCARNCGRITFPHRASTAAERVESREESGCKEQSPQQGRADPEIRDESAQEERETHGFCHPQPDHQQTGWATDRDSSGESWWESWPVGHCAQQWQHDGKWSGGFLE